MNKATLGAISALSLVSAASLAASPWGSCGSKSHDKAAASTQPVAGSQTIVDVASNAGSFGTLLAAAKAAGLVEALNGKGPITVFAPTDDAFAKLPKGTVEMLLKPENKGLLASVLSYHVVPGSVDSSDVAKRDSVTTLLGQRIDVTKSGGSLMIDNAGILSADVEASNGVIHVIDTVLMPSTDTIVETASKAGSFGTLLAAAKAAGLADLLGSEGPFTVFAPTDDAFAKLPEGTVESLLKPENTDKLASILKYHVVPGRIYADQAVEAKNAATAQGSSVTIKESWKGDVRVNNAKVVNADIDTSNGVIHVIDTVLLPE